MKTAKETHSFNVVATYFHWRFFAEVTSARSTSFGTIDLATETEQTRNPHGITRSFRKTLIENKLRPPLAPLLQGSLVFCKVPT